MVRFLFSLLLRLSTVSTPTRDHQHETESPAGETDVICRQSIKHYGHSCQLRTSIEHVYSAQDHLRLTNKRKHASSDSTNFITEIEQTQTQTGQNDGEAVRNTNPPSESSLIETCETHLSHERKVRSFLSFRQLWTLYDAKRAHAKKTFGSYELERTPISQRLKATCSTHHSNG